MSRFSSEDAGFMARALRLAARGLYSTRPNPAVGCVLVKDGSVVGEGWHRKAGEPHAEVVALQQAGEAAKGATAYVTLEPCSHYGRTPPCANALVDAGIARVVIASKDPNPEVGGGGIHLLHAHGITVSEGLMQKEAVALNRGFIKAMTEGMPYVRLKVATSLDGKIAAANGESQWITGVVSRQRGHLLRARHGAIITGVGTVVADNPSLNVRLPDTMLDRYSLDDALCHPLRVVLDSQLRMSPDAAMLQLPGQTCVITTADAAKRAKAMKLEAAGAQVVPVEADMHGRVELAAALRFLAQHHRVRDVLVEAGPTLSGAFLDAGLVDELHWFQAAKVLGDRGRDVFSLPGLSTLAQAKTFQRVSLCSLGEEIYQVFERS